MVMRQSRDYGGYKSPGYGGVLFKNWKCRVAIRQRLIVLALSELRQRRLSHEIPILGPLAEGWFLSQMHD